MATTITNNFTTYNDSSGVFTYTGPAGSNLQDTHKGGYWCWEDSKTPSSGTGPSSGYNTGYIYTEASSPTSGGDVFTLITSDTYDLSISTLDLSFYYNAHCVTAPKVTISVWNGSRWNVEDIFTPDDLKNKWHKYSLEINTYTNNDAKIKIDVEMPTRGTTYRHDFAIDVFTVSLTSSNDPIVLYYKDYNILKYKNDGIVFDGTAKTTTDLESIINNFLSNSDNYLFTNYPNGYIIYGPNNIAYYIKRHKYDYIKYDTDLVTINDAEDVVGWSGINITSDRLTSMNKMKSISSITNTGSNIVTYTPSNPIDLTNQIFRMWTFPSLFIYLKKTNAIRLYMSDGSNDAYWDLYENDSYKGGWINAILDTNKPSTDGSVNFANITSISIYYDYKITLDNKINTWVDFLRTGNNAYLSGLDVSLKDAVFIDNAESISFGMLSKVENDDVYVLKSNLTIGNTIDTTYSEHNAIIVFDEVLNNTIDPTIKYIGNGNVGEVTLTDVTISSKSVNYIFDISDTGLTKVEILNCNISNAKTVKLNSKTVITDIKSNVFNNCGSIYVNGSVFKDIAITNSGDDNKGVIIVDSDTALDNSSNVYFKTNTSYCVYVEANVSVVNMSDYIFDAPDGSQGCYALYWAGTTGTLTVNSVGRTNISYSGTLSAGGTIVINKVDSIDLETLTNKVDLVAADVRQIKVAQGTNLAETEEMIITSSGVRLVL